MITPTPKLIKIFKETPGAMSVAEGIALYNICLQAPEGDLMELGSHKGKSTIMIASAAKENSVIYLVEPEFSNNDWRRDVIYTSLKHHHNVVTLADYSTNVLPKHKNQLSFLFVDSGNHGEQIVQSEKPLYENKIVSGGIVAFHDLFSQFTAVTRCYEQLIASGNYEPIEINWQEIFDYVKENNLEDGNNSWHQYPELHHPPNFIGAVRRK